MEQSQPRPNGGDAKGSSFEPDAAPRSTTWTRIKIIAGVELVGLVMALVVPITPGKMEKQFHWPASWDEYFNEVFLSFLLVNGLFVIIFIAGWIYLKKSAARSSRT